jgi:hypothetical protein
VRFLRAAIHGKSMREVLVSVEGNIETVRRFYSAGPADDDRDRVPFFAPDAVWHVPGENPVSGSYIGAAAITTEIAARMAPLHEWDVELIDLMGNAHLVVATVRLRGERRGVRIESNGAHVFRLNDDGQVAEVWGFTVPQDRLDEFFRA